MWVQPFCEEVTCKFPQLLEALDALSDFKIYPSIVFIFSEIVLIDEFLGYLTHMDAEILGPVKWRTQVEI